MGIYQKYGNGYGNMGNLPKLGLYCTDKKPLVKVLGSSTSNMVTAKNPM